MTPGQVLSLPPIDQSDYMNWFTANWLTNEMWLIDSENFQIVLLLFSMISLLLMPLIGVRGSTNTLTASITICHPSLLPVLVSSAKNQCHKYNLLWKLVN